MRPDLLDFGAALDGLSAASGSAAASAEDGEVIEFEARDGSLWANGQPFSVRGVNWYGSESRTGAPNGLDHHSLDWYMKWIATEGFNSIRLLFNHQSALANGPIETADLAHEPALRGKRYLEMFQHVAAEAAYT